MTRTQSRECSLTLSKFCSLIEKEEIEMNGFITVAIAHDATCKPGEEWIFHGIGVPNGGNDDDDLLGWGCLICLLVILGIVIWACA